MVWIVSGLPRSGTSMMMRCFVEGGVPGWFDGHQDYLNVMFGDQTYMPNPNGFYALDTDFSSPEFPVKADGGVVKVSHRDLLRLPAIEPYRYTVAFMKRNPDEILASMRRFIPYSSWGQDEMFVQFYDLTLPALLMRLEARSDIESSYS